jgi:transcription initiation factor TFIIH subunit 1
LLIAVSDIANLQQTPEKSAKVSIKIVLRPPCALSTMSEAAALYKKQDGRLSLSADGKTVSWKANGSNLPPLLIAVSDIANLQQTPEKSAKVSIKIVLQKPSAAEPENHTFSFTSPTARADQVAITALLRKSIEAARAQHEATPAPPPDDGGQPAALAIAQAVSAAAKSDDHMYEDSKLMANAELQKSLLNSNPALHQRFDQALRERPDTITISQFATQFWATRIHLLRSHAVEKSQHHGTYNVLSEVKPTDVDGTTKLNLSKEQIQLIFNQHPLVKRVYNENVPQLSEMDFWARFFVSRLFKKLKGERIVETDSLDPKLDKYLNVEDEDEQGRQLSVNTVPHFMDLAGNEQNHSQRLGNRPDVTMQPNSHDKVPILRVLNQMSEKMMADVPPSDANRHAPAGMDEETYRELQLRDLQYSVEDNRIALNVQNQGQLFSANQDMQTSSSAAVYSKRTPVQVLSMIHNDIHAISGSKSKFNNINLESAIGVRDSSSSGEEGKPRKTVRVGATATRTAAMTHIMQAIRQRQLDTGDYAGSSASSSEQAAKMGLSRTVFETLAMTHNTTVEFLHYFWNVYLSGDVDRAGEVQKLVETLDKSLDRIKAVAESAEKERQAKVEKARKQIEDYAQRTGKRRKFDVNSIGGGAKTVNDMMGPVVRAIGAASGQYKKVYEAQIAVQNTS